MRPRWIAALAPGLFAAAVQAAPTVALQNGQPASFSMPAQSYSTSYYIDVDAASAQLKLELGNSSGGDTDLLLRYGTPFADRTANGDAAPDPGLFRQYSHYRSASAGGNESLSVQNSGTFPLRAGRWYIAVLNYSNQPQNLRLSASLTPTVAVSPIRFVFDQAGADCDIAGWNDPTPVTPIDGNSGTTRGQQRRNALVRAGELLWQELRSPVPVTVRACWDALGGDRDGATIAQAGPTLIVANDIADRSAWLPRPYTWYTITEAVRLGGTSQCGVTGGGCGNADIEATFNSDIDPPNNVVRSPFYYGYTGAAKPRNSIDFIATAMHELTHGLGFIGLVNVDAEDGPLGARFPAGDEADGLDDIFSSNLVAVDTLTREYQPFLAPQVSDARRAAALVSQDGLRWSGAEAVAALVNANRERPAPDNFPLMLAPCDRDAADAPCKTIPGTTLSHTVQSGDLMNGYDTGESTRTLGLALPMLDALGWSNAAAAPPVFPIPVTGNWFDRTRSGHGVDFQLYQRDAVAGDLYFIIFYTFEDDGRPEYYFGLGRLVDGRFIGARQGDGISLMRVRYNAAAGRGDLDTSSSGEIAIDFNQAAQSPYCRSADRSGAGALAVLRWVIRGEEGNWCLEPAVMPASRTTPDFSGHWYSGLGNDQGWGMELLSVRAADGQPQLVAIVYYPDLQGRSRWAVSELTRVNLADTPALPLYDVTSGYCRSCPAPAGAAQVRQVGTIQLKLRQPTRTEPADGVNRVSLNIEIPGIAGFRRQDSPLTLLSLPPGQ
ncbi:hypothetical protein [Tahibacter harae]|uniref:Uncharacterized protein n=1 Tax=Tahibacter harae TaxID=2963937 RepID=A0ABT1QY20_9GAMM|nr:hypothetical protein [Tahibacter harae]MCQ4167177.1 hypothetical protein [Tahibacter harae]